MFLMTPKAFAGGEGCEGNEKRRVEGNGGDNLQRFKEREWSARREGLAVGRGYDAKEGEDERRKKYRDDKN